MGSIGVSLMLSPHPSYPPLEMAMFGMEIITNKYANKDLSKITKCIHSVDAIEPNNIAKYLIESCENLKDKIDTGMTLNECDVPKEIANLFEPVKNNEFWFEEEIISSLVIQTSEENKI